MNLNDIETKQAYSLYTGFAEIQIIAVNPTVEELQRILNKEDVNEPKYKGEKGYRLDFWYKNHPRFPQELLGKFSLWVSNEVRVSNSGKKQIIDKFTRTFWASNQAEVSAYIKSKPVEYRPDAPSLREARIGEESIYSLLKAYANANPKNKPFVLDDWAAIGDGKVTELRNFFKIFNEKEQGIKVLLGVKEGRFQDVFTQLFLNIIDRVTEYHTSKVQGEYGFKSDYQGSFKFKTYNKEIAPETTEVEDDETNPFASTASIADPFASTTNSDSAETNPFGAVPAQEEDDLPF